MLAASSLSRQTLLSRSFASGGIPVIDMNLLRGSAEDRQKLAEQVDQGCSEIGFLTVVNHQVPREVIDNCSKEIWNFFDLPVEEKMKCPMTDEYHYGYSGYLDENLAAGYGVNRPPDLKESFAVGPYNPRALMAAVQYPDNPPQLKKALHDYFCAMETLSSDILKVFTLALRLPKDFFEEKISYHRSALRLLNYPEQTRAPEPNQIRAGEHTDYGSITILLQDKVGGLQVLDRQKQWRDVEPMADSFVVNLGDLMQQWTNDRWVSTLHRVVNNNIARRQSIAFFHNINHDQLVECIPTCTSPDNPPKHAPILAWDHLLQKHNASMAAANLQKSCDSPQ